MKDITTHATLTFTLHPLPPFPSALLETYTSHLRSLSPLVLDTSEVVHLEFVDDGDLSLGLLDCTYASLHESQTLFSALTEGRIHRLLALNPGDQPDTEPNIIMIPPGDPVFYLTTIISEMVTEALSSCDKALGYLRSGQGDLATTAYEEVVEGHRRNGDIRLPFSMELLVTARLTRVLDARGVGWTNDEIAKCQDLEVKKFVVTLSKSYEDILDLYEATVVTNQELLCGLRILTFLTVYSLTTPSIKPSALKWLSRMTMYDSSNLIVTTSISTCCRLLNLPRKHAYFLYLSGMFPPRGVECLLASTKNLTGPLLYSMLKYVLTLTTDAEIRLQCCLRLLEGFKGLNGKETMEYNLILRECVGTLRKKGDIDLPLSLKAANLVLQSPALRIRKGVDDKGVFLYSPFAKKQEEIIMCVGERGWIDIVIEDRYLSGVSKAWLVMDLEGRAIIGDCCDVVQLGTIVKLTISFLSPQPGKLTIHSIIPNSLTSVPLLFPNIIVTVVPALGILQTGGIGVVGLYEGEGREIEAIVRNVGVVDVYLGIRVEEIGSESKAGPSTQNVKGVKTGNVKKKGKEVKDPWEEYETKVFQKAIIPVYVISSTSNGKTTNYPTPSNLGVFQNQSSQSLQIEGQNLPQTAAKTKGILKAGEDVILKLGVFGKTDCSGSSIHLTYYAVPPSTDEISSKKIEFSRELVVRVPTIVSSKILVGSSCSITRRDTASFMFSFDLFNDFDQDLSIIVSATGAGATRNIGVLDGALCGSIDGEQGGAILVHRKSHQRISIVMKRFQLTDDHLIQAIPTEVRSQFIKQQENTPVDTHLFWYREAILSKLQLTWSITNNGFATQSTNETLPISSTHPSSGLLLLRKLIFCNDMIAAIKRDRLLLTLSSQMPTSKLVTSVNQVVLLNYTITSSDCITESTNLLLRTTSTANHDCVVFIGSNHQTLTIDPTHNQQVTIQKKVIFTATGTFSIIGHLQPLQNDSTLVWGNELHIEVV